MVQLVIAALLIPFVSGSEDTKESFIAGTFQRHPDDDSSQTNMFYFFENLPYGEFYRDAILGTQLLTITNRKTEWEMTFGRTVKGQSSNQTMPIQSGRFIQDPFLGRGLTVKTIIAKVKGNRVTLDRTLKGVNVMEVMHFTEKGCRTTYFTSNEYAIDFLRRKV